MSTSASPDLTLYTNPMSRGRIARWMLEEVGAPYEARILDYSGAMRTAEFLAINPMGKVPALVHGDAVVTEAAAICAYLADAFPEAGLGPPETRAGRAAYHRWLYFAAGPLEAATTNRALGFEVPAERERSAGYGTIERVMDAVSAHFADGRPYVAGDGFTAADVYFGSQVGWSLMFGSFEERPEFIAYRDRIMTRPAAKRAREADDALLETGAAEAAAPES